VTNEGGKSGALSYFVFFAVIFACLVAAIVLTVLRPELREVFPTNPLPGKTVKRPVPSSHL